MADNDQAEGGAEASEEAVAAPKGKLKLIIAAAVVLAIVGGGATWSFFLRHHGEEAHAEAPPPKPSSYVEVPDMLVNLVGSLGERVQYLKLKIVLELPDQTMGAQIQPVMPRVMDAFQTYLRELRPADLDGSGGLYRMRDELTRRINAMIAPHRINAVLFKEVVVQ